MDIVMSPRMIRTDAENLMRLVTDLNTSYAKFFEKLKPKFHHLIHYASALLNNGPLIKFWSIRFESYHRSVKLTAESTSSKRNLLKTIAIKQSLKLCQMINTLTFEDRMKYGSIRKKDENRSYFADQQKNENCVCYEKIEIDSVSYRVGTFLVVNLESSEVDFGEIDSIVCTENEIYFI